MITAIEYIAGFIGLCFGFWLLLSPRVATRLYHARLFAKNNEPGALQSLWAFKAVNNNELFFPSSDEQKLLHGWFFEHPNSASSSSYSHTSGSESGAGQADKGKVVLYNIGRSSDIARSLDYVKVMLEAGASVFVYEYRGFGLSMGVPTIKGICEDGVAAYDFLVNRLGFSAANIVLYGESLGAAVAAHVSSRRKAAGLVLQSGFASLATIGKEMVAILKLYPSWLFPRPALDNREAVSESHPPLLVLHGIKDDVIPVHHSNMIFDEAPEPKRLVHLPNSAHTDLHGQDRPSFVDALTEFLAELQ